MNSLTLPREAAPYGQTIETASQEFNVPAPLLTALLKAESGFNPAASSSSGAQGIAQFMPATAAQYGVDPWDANSSIFGAAHYLSDLYAWTQTQFGTASWPLALAAYNAGPGAVAAANGIPNNGETPSYVSNVLTFAGQYGYNPPVTQGTTDVVGGVNRPASPQNAGFLGIPGAISGAGKSVSDAIGNFTSSLQGALIVGVIVTIALALVAGGFVWLAAGSQPAPAKDIERTGEKATVIA